MVKKLAPFLTLVIFVSIGWTSEASTLQSGAIASQDSSARVARKTVEPKSAAGAAVVEKPKRGLLGLSIGEGAHEDDVVLAYELFTKNNTKDGEVIKPKSKGPAALEHWQAGKKAIIIVHGWMESPNLEGGSAQTLKKAYLTEGHSEENIILVDWSHTADDLDYDKVAHKVKDLSKKIAEFLVRLVEKKYVQDFKLLHLIGYGMGAHVVGIAGFKASKLSNGTKVARITGLDPAKDGFGSREDEHKRLTKDDADVVDVIHSNVGTFGSELECGTMDFFPNGGIMQPNCKENQAIEDPEICSTRRSYKLYAASIGGASFKACLCKNYEVFIDNSCDCTVSSNMGENVTLDAKPGNYYLDTKVSYDDDD